MFREGSFSWFKRDKTDEGEKTKRIPGGGDGISLEPHPLAGEKTVSLPYEDTDNPVRAKEGYKTVEDIESHHSGTGNPEEMMIAEEEEEAKDPYVMYNAQGDTRLPQKEVTFEDYEEDEKLGAKDINNKEKVVLKSSKEENFKTLAEITTEKKAKIKEEIFWDRSEKRPNRDRGQKPIRKNRPTGIRKILGK
jgi:hypothetical protein